MAKPGLTWYNRVMVLLKFKGKKMITWRCCLVWLLLGLGQPLSLWAQPAAGRPDSLGLSPVQTQALAEVEQRLGEELRSRRQEFLARRLEFRAALANPQVEAAAVRAKAAVLRQSWQQCQELTTEYYLAIRTILTPVQWQQWWQAEMNRTGRRSGLEP